MRGNLCTLSSRVRGKNKDKFELNLKDGIIPYNQNPKFLGIDFDESLNLKIHTENLTARKWQKNGKLSILTYVAIV